MLSLIGLLAGLGLGGQVAGGKGKLGVDASWRGGPEALDPNMMDATVSLDARDGRLLWRQLIGAAEPAVDVEAPGARPGAGGA